MRELLENLLLKVFELLKVNKNPLYLAKCLMYLAVVNLEKGAYIEAKKCFEESLKLCQIHGFAKFEANNLKYLGVIHNNRGDEPNKAITYLEKALEIFRELEDRKGQNACLLVLTDVKRNTGCYEESIDMCMEILETAESHHFEVRGFAFVGLSNTYARKGNHIIALEYGEKALKLSQKNKFLWGQIYALQCIGGAYHGQMKFDLAFETRNKRLALCQKMGYRPFIESTLCNLGQSIMELGQYAKAKNFLEDALMKVEESGNKRIKLYALLYLSNLSHLTHEDVNALNYGKEALELTQKQKNGYLEGEIHMYYGRSQAALGHLFDAKSNFERALELRQKNNLHHLYLVSLADMANICLQLGSHQEANEYIAEILAEPYSEHFNYPAEPLHIGLICYKVLSMNQDPRAPQILQQIHSSLLENANSIENLEFRDSFLNNIATHQEIIQIYQASNLDAK